MRLALRAGAGAGLTVLLALLPSFAGADPPDEALLAAQVAASRASARLGALTRAPDLDAIARRQAGRMAAAGGAPFHNGRLFAETGAWLSVGEVVGRIEPAAGWDTRLHQGFLASPVHRRVILNGAYTHVGIGTARSAGGMLYAAEVFGRSPAGRPAPASRGARRSPPVARPPVTAPPVTAPPATATTAPPPPPRMTTSTTLPAGVLVALPPWQPVRQHASGPVDMAGAGALLFAVGALVRTVRRPAT